MFYWLTCLHSLRKSIIVIVISFNKLIYMGEIGAKCCLWLMGGNVMPEFERHA